MIQRSAASSTPNNQAVIQRPNPYAFAPTFKGFDDLRHQPSGLSGKNCLHLQLHFRLRLGYSRMIALLIMIAQSPLEGKHAAINIHHAHTAWIRLRQGCLQIPQRVLLSSGLLAKKLNQLLLTCPAQRHHYAREGKVLGTAPRNHFLAGLQPCSIALLLLSLQTLSATFFVPPAQDGVRVVHGVYEAPSQPGIPV